MVEAAVGHLEPLQKVHHGQALPKEPITAGLAMEAHKGRDQRALLGSTFSVLASEEHLLHAHQVGKLRKLAVDIAGHQDAMMWEVAFDQLLHVFL